MSETVPGPVAGPAAAPGTVTGRSWTVVLPLKGGAGAKSRLGGPPRLAAAIAADCLASVLACPDVREVLVVTADAATKAAATRAGARVVAERRPGAGLPAAVRDGVSAVGDRLRPVAILLGDLPALRPDDLATALRAAGTTLAAHPTAPMAAVPDAQGTGTVLLAAREAGALDPAFGAGSAAEHTRRGAVRLDLDLPRLRRDVDTPTDLGTALALGCGPRTARLCAVRHYPGAVQATVYRFDPVTADGAVVTDDGHVLPFDSTAFATSGLMLLRPGQRIAVTISGGVPGGRVTSLWLESVGAVPATPPQHP